MFTARDIAVGAFVKIDAGLPHRLEGFRRRDTVPIRQPVRDRADSCLSKASLERLVATGIDAFRTAQSSTVQR
jgi:hypothetical protein